MTDLRSAAIILDVDGTLVDSNDAHARAWVDAFAEGGMAVSFEQVRRAIGMGGDKLVPHVAGISEDSPQGRRISDRRGDIFKSRYLPHLRPFPRVRELIEQFARDGFTIVVASSAKKEELRPLLDIAGVTDLIEARTSSDDADESKPDPDIVVAALKQSGVSAATAIMLGDTPYDVEAAQRAGIRAVALECGGWRRDDLRGAVEVYASAAHVLERYERSVFAELRQRVHARRERGDSDVRRVAVPLLLAGGMLVLVGLAEQKRRGGRRDDSASEYPFSDTHRQPHAQRPRRRPLSRRDRERLRRVIARTS
jgi:HAD superfamily hydrolase (TIGR01509 family)